METYDDTWEELTNKMKLIQSNGTSGFSIMNRYGLN